MWQAEHVKGLFERLRGDIRCELVPMTTSGDVAVDESLQTLGGKGLFLKELELALLEDQADLAVHSMKDVPVRLDADFSVQSVGAREVVEDVLVCQHALHELPLEARIGTSSVRRRALLRHVYKRETTLPVRGNVQTRLKKLDENVVDALVLAYAGLKRLGLMQRAHAVFPKALFVPAVGQGVLAAEYRRDRDDVRDLLDQLQHPDVARAVAAERLVAARVEADCAAAFGAHCMKIDDRFEINAIVLSESGDHAIQARAHEHDPLVAAERVAERLLKQGAAQLLVHP